MTVPTQKDVSEMDRLMKIMNGEKPTARPIEESTGSNQDGPLFERGVTRGDVDAMAKIMSNFSDATGVQSFKNLHDSGKKSMDDIVDRSRKDRNLREALLTERTEAGVKIGAWEIGTHLREGLTKKEEKVYSVRNANTAEVLDIRFIVLEAAKATVRLLNNGSDLGHPMIREIAELELKYRRLRERALEEKLSWHRAKKRGDEFKMSLYAAKFDAAKANALLAKETIKRMYYEI